jgi:hypothetical protein
MLILVGRMLAIIVINSSCSREPLCSFAGLRPWSLLARLPSKPFWAMSKCFDLKTLVKTPSKSPSKLVKLAHTRRGAHFEDLDEAHPSKVLQEAISLHLVSNIKKPAFLPCQNSVKMSSAIQQVPFPLHESPWPLIQYIGPNQLEQNTSTIKTNAHTLNELPRSQFILLTVTNCSRTLQPPNQNISTIKL